MQFLSEGMGAVVVAMGRRRLFLGISACHSGSCQRRDFGARGGGTSGLGTSPSIGFSRHDAIPSAQGASCCHPVSYLNMGKKTCARFQGCARETCLKVFVFLLP